VADAAIGAALMIVPLAFHTGVREFAVFKLLVLSACVGLALIAIALSRPSVTGRPLVLLLPAVHVLVVLTWQPSFPAVNQSMALLGPLLLAWALALRVSRWSKRKTMLLIGLPLVLNLGWSLLQGLGVGVLPATATAFGTTHGVLVGAVGNPNENCWYLVVGTTLLLGVWPKSQRKWATVLVAGVVLVVVLDRSRAVMLASLAGALTWGMLRSSGRKRAAVALLFGAALVCMLGVAWGGIEALAGRAYLARIELWMLADRAGLPAGLGAFAVDFPSAQAATLALHPAQADFHSRIDHAHNDLFEVLYELGAFALIWIAALGVVVWRSRRQATPLQVAAIVCLVEGAVLSAFGYPLFSPAAAVVLAFALAVCLSRGRGHRLRIPWIGRALLLLLGIGLVVASARRYQAERAITRALQAVYDDDIERAHRHAAEAERAWPESTGRRDRW
jgi:hypothetical protein